MCVFFFWITCEQLSNFHVCGLPQQSHQSGDASTVLQGYLVVVIDFAVHQVPQCSTGTAVDICHPVVQQVHQQLDATLPPDLRTEKEEEKWRQSHKKEQYIFSSALSK